MRWGRFTNRWAQRGERFGDDSHNCFQKEGSSNSSQSASSNSKQHLALILSLPNRGVGPTATLAEYCCRWEESRRWGGGSRSTLASLYRQRDELSRPWTRPLPARTTPADRRQAKPADFARERPHRPMIPSANEGRSRLGVFASFEGLGQVPAARSAGFAVLKL